MDQLMKLSLALLCVVIATHLVSGDGIFCEGKAGYIRCPPGEVIVVYNANYGRTEGADVCPHKSISNTNCRAATSYRKVSELCDGKSSCKVRADHRVFGDPCFGTYKYLEVQYKCLSRV